MKINEILRSKDDKVITIGSEQTVGELLALLAEYGIGAVVVSDDDGASVGGIVSERDVVRHLNTGGPEILTGPVSAIMTREVFTCTHEYRIEELAKTMTERRIRHAPIVEDGRLTAIISIGDVVKHRISTLETERNQLVEYINQ